MKLLSLVGARPQFIKLAPLSRALRTRHEEIVVHTGQHYDDEMSDLIFKDLQIPQPDYNLGIQGGGHGEQTGRMMAALEELFLQVRPDTVIIFGDTNTTLAGALVAAKLQIRSVHIEAGLRSFNRTMPEEINRIVADHVCDLLCAPTPTAMDNLAREGLAGRSHLTGDIMVDSLELALEISRKTVTRDARRVNPELRTVNPEPFSLLTLHRPYNVDDPANLGRILGLLGGLGEEVIFPVHPRTRAVIERHGLSVPANIRLIKPVGYLEFIDLQANAVRILTDSGGIQKEAYLLGVPCITLRPETEWVETVEAGWNLLLNPDDPEFIKKVTEFLPEKFRTPIFGEGVSAKILNLISL